MSNRSFHIDTEKLLNIKKGEGKTVSILFAHNFFQGFALALFFTSANAIFLSNYAVSKLPLVYILSAVVLMLVGYIYSYLESKILLKHLLGGSVILLVITSFSVWAGLQFITFSGLGILVLIIYRINFILGNLEFWGISGVVFDVRQSKRLFGIISSGEVTAKLIGYLSVPVLVGKLGNNNIIGIAAVSFAISAIFLYWMISIRPDIAREGKKSSQQTGNDKPKENMLRKYFNSDFIVLLSLLSFITIIAFTLIEFTFLTNVQHQFKTDAKKLAEFLGFFFAFTKGITFLVKLFFTGRMIDVLGVKKSLLLLPIFFIAIVLIIIFYSFGSPDEQNLIYLFGFLMLIQEIFRYALHEPVFFSLFQPLKRNLRLFGQAIVNGLLNPLGIGITGIILAILFSNHQNINLNVVSYLIFTSLVAWIIGVILTNRQYIVVLQQAVNKRLFEGSEMALKGKVVYDLLLQKLNSQYPEEVIYSAQLLLQMDDVNIMEVLTRLLKHPSDEVKIYTLNKIEEEKITRLKQVVFEIIESDENDTIKEAALNAYCVIDEFAVEKTSALLESKNLQIRKGSISGLLKNGGLEAVVVSGQHLLELINSGNDKDQIIASEIMGDLGIKNFYQPIIRFFNNSNPIVLKSAIEASGKIANPHFIPYLLNFLQKPDLHEIAAKALIRFGDEAISAIEKASEKKNITTAELFNLLQICGKIGGENAHKLLLKHISYPDLKIQAEVYAGLRKSGYKAFGNENFIRENFEHYFGRASWLYQSIYFLENDKDSDILKNALRIEIAQVTEIIFNLLSYMYDTRTLFKVKEGILNAYGEKQANALEIIDNLISKRMSSKLSVILEHMSLQERVNKLSSIPPIVKISKESIVSRILNKKNIEFNNWTQVTALEYLKNYASHDEQYILFRSYLDHPDKMLNESANYTIRKLIDNKNLSLARANQLFSKQTVEKIMETTEQQGNVLLDIEKVIILKSTSLFTETPENILVDVASIIKEERVEAGTTIFHKGDMGYCMYIINEGEIRIHDNELTFAVFKNRDFFGELALLDPEPRSASATALKDSLLLRLDQDAFYELMSERMEVAKGILKILCRRIREQNQRIMNLQNN